MGRAVIRLRADLRNRWIAALRSHQYPQIKGNLRTIDGYCCLGVLCDLTPELAHWIHAGRHSIWGSRAAPQETCHSIPPNAVLKALFVEWGEKGMKEEQADFITILQQKNDLYNFTFEEISDYIEAYTIGIES